MRPLGLLLATALLTPLGAAQSLAPAPPAPADAVVLVEVAPEDLPPGIAESLATLPENAAVLTLGALPAGYRLPPGVLDRASEKDETVGLLLSIIVTGGGHFYAGETSKGIGLLLVGIGAPIAGALASSEDNLAPYFVGLGVGLGAYIYGIVDGMRAVEDYNVENGFALAPVPMESGAGLAMRVGL